MTCDLCQEELGVDGKIAIHVEMREDHPAFTFCEECSDALWTYRGAPEQTIQEVIEGVLHHAVLDAMLPAEVKAHREGK